MSPTRKRLKYGPYTPKRELPVRPGIIRFVTAAPPELARALYEGVVRELRASGLRTETGEFQAMMQVSLVNDGPVTILLDSRKGF